MFKLIDSQKKKKILLCCCCFRSTANCGRQNECLAKIPRPGYN